MRTCPNCGCYVPDKWINCPACGGRVKIGKEALNPYPFYNTESKTFFNGIYRVKVSYKDGNTLNSMFETREQALKRARKILDKFWYCIEIIEVFDYNAQKRIGLFYPNT